MALRLSDIKEFENLEFLAKELVEGFITGLHRSPYHGFSVEFAEHKLYNYGESTRNIDWKVFARTDRLYTKQYEEETNLRCTILLDTSGSMFYPAKSLDKIKFSIYSAAALSYLMIKQRDAIGLISFADSILQQTPQKSTKAHLNLILKTLDQWLNHPPSDQKLSNISANIHLAADKLHRRSLVILFTDMFQQSSDLDEIFQALQHLKHNKHEVLLFHVTHFDSERAFDFDDRPYRFIDTETNEVVKVSPGFMKAAYRSKMAEFYEKVKIGCGKLKIDFIEVDANDPFNKILGTYLIKRRRMK